MRYSRWELPTTLSSRPSSRGLSRESRGAIAPPWPELVLTAGRRNEAAARWISQASNKRSKIVHIGRPWHHPRHFDLVITTPQYQINPAPNVVCLDLPLHAALHRIARTDKFDHLPEPRLALLIGGHSGALTLHRHLAQQLVDRASGLAQHLAGSLLVSTSARTPAAVNEILSGLRVPNHTWCWGAPENPYRDYLDIADAFIVTSDSVSMLAEALTTAKPLLVFDLKEDDWWQRLANYRPNALLHRIAMRVAPKRLRRDVGCIHQRLIDSGNAQWLEPHMTQLPTASAYQSVDLSRATEAVRALCTDETLTASAKPSPVD